MPTSEVEILLNNTPENVFSSIEKMFLEFSVFLNYTGPHVVSGGGLAKGQDISAEVEIQGPVGFETVGQIVVYNPEEYQIAFGFATLAYYKDGNTFAPMHERKRNAIFGMWCLPDGPSGTTFRSKVTLSRRLFGGASPGEINNMVVQKIQMISSKD